MVVAPTPARALPSQDYAALDAREARARTITYGAGMVAGAILVITLCALCARAWF